jgi:hypothetical protein
MSERLLVRGLELDKPEAGAQVFSGWKVGIRRKPGTDMNFLRSLPEMRCGMIYWTTTKISTAMRYRESPRCDAA